MENHRFKGKTFLVVDDEPLLREILKDELEFLGSRVVEAENGRDAFDLLVKSPVDAVISDIRMKGGSGLELLDRVRQMGQPAPPVILVSAHHDSSEQDVLKRGARAFFQKPFNSESIIEVLGKLICADLTHVPQQWNPAFAIGNSHIDSEHQKLFALVNDLAQTRTAGAQQYTLAGVILDQLVQYPDYHFKTEEALMEQVEYPDLAKHRALHETIRQTIRDYRKDFLKSEREISGDFCAFLCDWLDTHLLKVDQELKNYIIETTS